MSRFSQRYSYGPFGIGGWTPAVKILVVANVIAFLLQIFDRVAGGSGMVANFGLTPARVTQNFYLWQLVTYMFLHDSGQLFHILFNMLGLWMFGSELERAWGTRQFTKFYFICGIGAGILSVMFSPGSPIPTIGASGAIYGVLAAFGILFPNRIIYWIIFPIPAKWFVLILGGMAFFASLSASGGGVAHIAHLGGMLCGLMYLKGGTIFTNARYHYDRWRRNRLRRKFEVYYNEKRRDEVRHDDQDQQPPRWRQ